VAGPWRPLAHRLARFIVKLPPAQRRVIECGNVLISCLMSTPSLKREFGVRLQCRRLWWNRHHGLSGRCVLWPCYGCGGGKQSPHIAPSGRGEVRAPFSIRSRVELLGGVLYHGPQRGWWPTAG
jgi:hypothetical protein